jgi:hypothetical protein
MKPKINKSKRMASATKKVYNMYIVQLHKGYPTYPADPKCTGLYWKVCKRQHWECGKITLEVQCTRQ